MKSITHKIEVGGRTLTLEHGRFAEQAGSAVTARYGDTLVLVTVVAAPLKQELDYFPLTVEYMERLYAGGRIKGSRWVKREGRPSDDEILTARLIDRSIRPLFPKSYKKEVQVVATVLSVDSENDPGILSMVAASAALATSPVPWNGPVGSLRIGAKEGMYMANPTDSELAFSDLDLVLTTSKDNIFMIEAGALQVPEEKVLEAIAFGHAEAKRIIRDIEEFARDVGSKKEVYEDQKNHDLLRLVEKKFGDQILDFAKTNSAKESGVDSTQIKKAISEEIGEENFLAAGVLFEEVMRKRVRELILNGTRLDGRRHDQIREIICEVGVLPRTHGSAIFKRGQTQVMSATTVGAPSLSQLIETAEGEETKRYIHHYSMPPYASGETGRLGAPSRREIGHGALAERALLPVIPAKDKFPYTIMVVSEVMSSNGSTSMASTCCSTLSLMDAGVPILAPVSGIAVGLIIEGEKVVILSDIMGLEDYNGDMDFKVAGSREGVTAIQLDVKTHSLTLEILKKALEQARVGRLYVLDKMLEAIPAPREKISQFAPIIVMIKVPVEKIGEIIGPGGRIIKKIMSETGCQLDMDDDGTLTISGINQEAVEKARTWIEGLIKEVQPGEIYEGEVKRIQPFGVFVEVLPGKDGLVHVSDMSEGFVKDPNDVVKIGNRVQVRVKEIDDLGRINLSMILDPAKDKPREGGERRREGRDQRRHGRPRRLAPPSMRDRRGLGSGPHFPASRFMPSKKRF